jgi:uncharacterized protein (TIGR02996 family)
VTDPAPLVAASLAAPADPQVRLVLADALDEAADPRGRKVRALVHLWEWADGFGDWVDVHTLRDTQIRLGRLRLRVIWGYLCVRTTPLDAGGRVWDLLADGRSRRAVAAGELWACGLLGDDELAVESAAADAAYRDAATAARPAGRVVPRNADARRACARAAAARAAALTSPRVIGTADEAGGAPTSVAAARVADAAAEAAGEVSWEGGLGRFLKARKRAAALGYALPVAAPEFAESAR